jgi:hypothetical protein
MAPSEQCACTRMICASCELTLHSISLLLLILLLLHPQEVCAKVCLVLRHLSWPHVGNVESRFQRRLHDSGHTPHLCYRSCVVSCAAQKYPA